MEELFIVACMLFMHIIDDFCLQGVMAQMKQKEWWQKNAPDEMYKNDYVMPLIAHSFSWSFFIMIPLFIYCVFYYGGIGFTFIVLLIVNTIAHAVIDHAKCNAHKINLIQDQLLHIVQILISAAVIMAL